MQINKYAAYSVVSLTENKNQNEIAKILNLIEDLESIKSIKKAKEYLKNTYGIKDSVQNFPISSVGLLHVNENDKKYSIRVIYKDQEESECVIYSYKK